MKRKKILRAVSALFCQEWEVFFSWSGALWENGRHKKIFRQGL
jgi:hypothetical protein